MSTEYLPARWGRDQNRTANVLYLLICPSDVFHFIDKERNSVAKAYVAIPRLLRTIWEGKSEVEESEKELMACIDTIVATGFPSGRYHPPAEVTAAILPDGFAEYIVNVMVPWAKDLFKKGMDKEPKMYQKWKAVVAIEPGKKDLTANEFHNSDSVFIYIWDFLLAVLKDMLGIDDVGNLTGDGQDIKLPSINRTTATKASSASMGVSYLSGAEYNRTLSANGASHHTARSLWNARGSMPTPVNPQSSADSSLSAPGGSTTQATSSGSWTPLASIRAWASGRLGFSSEAPSDNQAQP